MMMRKTLFSKQTVIAGVILLVLMLMAGYKVIQYADQQTEYSFTELTRALHDACHRQEGCYIIPEGWIEGKCPSGNSLTGSHICATPPDSTAYQGLVYWATSEEFVARWHYVEGTELVARGGRGRTLDVQKVSRN